jgi:hypothetical protein
MDEAEEQHSHMPTIDYETDLLTADFIYFVQDYSHFLREYINSKYRDDPEEVGYLTSFIDVCDGIDTDAAPGEEEYYNYYERYRNSLQPLMEWITLWAEDMNKFYENSYKNHQKQTPEPSPKGVASRTRSKRPLETSYEIPPPKRGTNMITLEPTKQEGVRITLSDGKSYTYDEIKDMWRFSKVQTLYRHPYTLEDKQKITDFLDFGTKGGRKKRKTKKNKTKNNKKVYKKKSRKTRKQTVYL